ncbi:hypothetical protein RHSIM_Rhsim11G0150200 [Rhododendron simsii]|uniref:Amino acid transporter transmembrane domain-containing protein n=1 Tax=Rhododendron simsii TaxID=118357 RepID=A0A834G610_RHOSS|nr:hypothetical protein RHSIM_Rhsim11G0150200 [Rhododendron simsii]
MKAASWPLVSKKSSKPSDSPPSDQNSHGFIAATSDQISSESVSSKPTTPLDIFKEQVVEFMRRLRALDSKMPSEIRTIVSKEPVLNLVQECHSIVEDEFEKEFSRLENQYYAELAEQHINEEHDDGMNESDTFAVMSFTYSTIGLGLSIAKIVGGAHVKTSLTGVSVGDEDTLKSSPPENTVMRKATLIGISITTMFYMLCGVLGYAAFGNNAPGNFLTGFGFYEPFWLVDFANLCIVVHLVGAYQVYGQPVYGFVESWCQKKWPQSGFIAREYPIPTPFGSTFNFNFFRLVWRTAYVIFTTVVATMFPFFNDFLGLMGAATFWPLTVYFPIEMYISQAQIRRFSPAWICMQLLSMLCLIVSLLAAAGSIQGLIKSVQTYKPFQSIS